MQMAKVTVSQPDSVTASEGLVDRVEYDGTPVPAELVEFFADREGVLQVFEFDNDAVFDFNWRFFRNSLFFLDHDGSRSHRLCPDVVLLRAHLCRWVCREKHS